MENESKILKTNKRGNNLLSVRLGLGPIASTCLPPGRPAYRPCSAEATRRRAGRQHNRMKRAGEGSLVTIISIKVSASFFPSFFGVTREMN